MEYYIGKSRIETRCDYRHIHQAQHMHTGGTETQNLQKHARPLYSFYRCHRLYEELTSHTYFLTVIQCFFCLKSTFCHCHILEHSCNPQASELHIHNSSIMYTCDVFYTLGNMMSGLPRALLQLLSNTVILKCVKLLIVSGAPYIEGTSIQLITYISHIYSEKCR